MFNQKLTNCRWRRILTFDGLEDRCLPSVIIPSASQVEIRMGEQTVTRQAPDNCSVANAIPRAMAVNSPNPATSTPTSAEIAEVHLSLRTAGAWVWFEISRAGNLPSSPDLDEMLPGSAGDIAEVLAWFRNARGSEVSWLEIARADDDWLEDLHEFLVTYPIAALPQAGIPPAGGMSENSRIDYVTPAEFPPTTVVTASKTELPNDKVAVEDPAVPTMFEANGMQLMEWELAVRLAITVERNVSGNDAWRIETPLHDADVQAAPIIAQHLTLIQDAAFVDLAQLEESMRHFLAGFEQGLDRVLDMIDGNKWPVSWIACALVSAATIELARRQLRCPATALDIASLPHGSGLRHRRVSGNL